VPRFDVEVGKHPDIQPNHRVVSRITWGVQHFWIYSRQETSWRMPPRNFEIRDETIYEDRKQKKAIQDGAAPPTIEETESLMEAIVDDLIKNKPRELLFAHLLKAGLPPFRLGAKLRKWINGDDDQGKGALQGLLDKMKEMKDSLYAPTDELKVAS